MQAQRIQGESFLAERLGLETTSSKKVYYYYCKHPGCTYKTIRSGHLKRHERIHTKEKPYKCQFCSYTAARSDPHQRYSRSHFLQLSGCRAFSQYFVDELSYGESIACYLCFFFSLPSTHDNSCKGSFCVLGWML